MVQVEIPNTGQKATPSNARALSQQFFAEWKEQRRSVQTTQEVQSAQSAQPSSSVQPSEAVQPPETETTFRQPQQKRVLPLDERRIATHGLYNRGGGGAVAKPQEADGNGGAAKRPRVMSGSDRCLHVSVRGFGPWRSGLRSLTEARPLRDVWTAFESEGSYAHTPACLRGRTTGDECLFEACALVMAGERKMRSGVAKASKRAWAALSSYPDVRHSNPVAP